MELSEARDFFRINEHSIQRLNAVARFFRAGLEQVVELLIFAEQLLDREHIFCALDFLSLHKDVTAVLRLRGGEVTIVLRADSGGRLTGRPGKPVTARQTVCNVLIYGSGQGTGMAR